MSTDIFVKTYPGDHKWLPFLLASIQKYCTGFRNVVIVTDQGGVEDCVKHCMGPMIEKLNIKISGSTPFINNPAHKWGPTGTGYQHQKGVKCDWISFTDADAVLQVDSDCIFTRPCSPDYWQMPAPLLRKQRFVWFVKPWSEATKAEIKTWGPGRDFFFGGPNPYNWMVQPGFFLTRMLTVAFQTYIQEKFDQTVYELFLDKGQGKPHLSVYNTLGLFLDMMEPGYLNYAIITPEEHQARFGTGPNPIHQFWSWGGIKPEIIEQAKLHGYEA